MHPAKSNFRKFKFYTINSYKVQNILPLEQLTKSLLNTLNKKLKYKVFPCRPLSIFQSVNLIRPNGFFPIHNDRQNRAVLVVIEGSDQVLDILLPSQKLSSLCRKLKEWGKDSTFLSKIIFLITKALKFIFSQRISFKLDKNRVVIFDGEECLHQIRNPNSSMGSHLVLAFDTKLDMDYTSSLDDYYGGK